VGVWYNVSASVFAYLFFPSNLWNNWLNLRRRIITVVIKQYNEPPLQRTRVGFGFALPENELGRTLGMKMSL
jgi:hypothetical protein